MSNSQHMESKNTIDLSGNNVVIHSPKKRKRKDKYSDILNSIVNSESEKKQQELIKCIPKKIDKI